MSVESAFEKFMKEAFEDACVSSTKASFSGSGYSVELFDSGSYRVLWDNNIGNQYDSPGLILSIPALGEDEFDESENGPGHFFGSCEEAIRESFVMHCEANLQVQHVISQQEI